ncbi:hypothetical protein K502DRAFT_206306 [Neoconidiobolus thromboides FSU 785]|nr:hypothetical protein K502DRAFT_206306 [Neoconidiobolus thromboides FSU 785]
MDHMGVFFLTSLFFPFFKRYLSGKFVSKIVKHKNTSPYEVIHKHLYDSYSIKHKRTSVIYNRIHAKFLKSAM